MKEKRYVPKEESPVVLVKDGQNPIIFPFPAPVYDPEGKMLYRLAAVSRGRRTLFRKGWKEKKEEDKDD